MSLVKGKIKAYAIIEVRDKHGKLKGVYYSKDRKLSFNDRIYLYRSYVVVLYNKIVKVIKGIFRSE